MGPGHAGDSECPLNEHQLSPVAVWTQGRGSGRESRGRGLFSTNSDSWSALGGTMMGGTDAAAIVQGRETVSA